MHDPGLGIPPQSYLQNPFSGSTVRVTINVTYGELDFFDTQPKCDWKEVGDLRICVITTQMLYGNRTGVNRPTNITYTQYTAAPKLFSVQLMGTFGNVTLALDQMLYRPQAQQNSIRLKSRIYSPASAKEQPYEEMKIRVDYLEYGDPFAAAAPFKEIGSLSQLIYTVNINDAPTITEPKAYYLEPGYCRSAAADSLPPAPDFSRVAAPECHFGQYFSYEDADNPVNIKGVEIGDLDLYELCTFTQQECAKVDVSVRTLKGAIALNTRTGLQFYENTRGGQGFTSFLGSANTAVKVLVYRVEETQFLGPSSSVLNYNTQHNNFEEAILVSVSDQGFTGAAGVSRVHSIQIDVQIVATNDQPVISINTLEYVFVEDEQVRVRGIVVADADVDEQITSTLSQLTWTNGAANMTYLNNLRATVSVTFGILRMNYARNLRIVRTNVAFFVSIKAYRSGHDLCRLKTVYTSEASALKSSSELKMAPVTYRSSCVLSNAGTTECPTSNEADCVCIIDDECGIPVPNMVLYLNISRPYQQFMQVLENLVSNTDKTCGGLPVSPL
jgi:hypothetical protein